MNILKSILILILCLAALAISGCSPKSVESPLFFSDTQVVNQGSSYQVSGNVQNRSSKSGNFRIGIYINSELRGIALVQLDSGEMKPFSAAVVSPSQDGKINLLDITDTTSTVALLALKILSYSNSRENGSLIVYGEVKNISTQSMENVVATVDFYAKDDSLVKSEEAPIKGNPILADQTTQFEVKTTDNPNISRYTIGFKYAMGGEIPSTMD
jgi:hypothetical protein